MFYSLLYTLAMLLAGPVLLLRGKSRNKYLPSLLERLGFYRRELNPTGKPAIWVHAVSVGEALAAQSLVDELRRRLPTFAILVSTSTVTGQEQARSKLNADGFFYFPFDWKFSVRRALKKTGAQLCIVLETELWPNFIRTLGRTKVPLMLANGRISDRSFKRYKRLGFFFGPLLRRYHTLCSQSDLDAKRLIEIGAHPWDVVTTGNLKYRREQFRVDDKEISTLRELLNIDSSEFTFIAGSTHEGEEAAALEAFRQAKKENTNLRLILVPRKPDRFDEVAHMLKRKQIQHERYSTLRGRTSKAEVILVDTIGLLKTLYHLADVAFVGGSIAPLGGHNLLEAGAAGVPVLFGPNMSNFRSVAEDVLRCGAGRQVKDEDELAAALKELLSNRDLRKELAHNAAKVFESRQEALPLTFNAARKALVEGLAHRPPNLAVRMLAKVHATAAGLIRRKPEKILKKAAGLNKLVIAVGGLSFGGAGKSPMTLKLAKHYLKQGKKVAVLTRGYRGTGREPLIVCDGKDIQADAEIAGDEPIMLVRAAPGLIVIKDRNRLRGGLMAKRQFNPDIFLLDDGFQHRAMARDFNLLMIDTNSLVEARTPAQLLREPISFASAADAMVLLDSANPRGKVAERKLRAAGAGAPVFHAGHEAFACSELYSGDVIDLSSLRGRRLLAFCGIAVPARFASNLMDLGVGIIGFHSFRDHYRFTQEDISLMAAQLKEMGGNDMITTEKDAQRLVDLETGDLKIFVLHTNLKIDRFEELVGLIDQKLAK